jgi:hypothetical protein
MPSSDLRTSLDALAQNFAAALVNAIRGSNLEDILALAGGPGPSTAKRGPGRPRKELAGAAPRPVLGVKRGPGRPRKAEAAPSKKADKADANGRGDTKKAKAVQLLVAYVKSHPGENAERVRKALGLNREVWLRAVAHGLDQKLVRREGERRGTRYWAV